MSELYWEAKIQALLSAHIFGSLNNNTASGAIARSLSKEAKVVEYLDLAVNLGNRTA